MRAAVIQSYWPEYKVFKNLKAQKFTFAVEKSQAGKYIQFIRTNPCSSELTPKTELDDEDSVSSDSPTWQETDTLANKTIPLYNFVRKFFHTNFARTPRQPLRPPRLPQIPVDEFVIFPTARGSTGSIIRDCAFCYLNGWHCGYHAVPNQAPFYPTCREGDDEEDTKTLQTQFQDLSYVDMRKVCRDVVEWTDHSERKDSLNIAAIFDYRGWPEPPNSELLAQLDAAVEAGWTCKQVNKGEVLQWDMLYREVYSLYGHRHTFCRD